MTEDAGRPEREAWDRFGDYLQAMGALGTRTWTRSFDLWTQVADTLDEPVTTNTFSANTARAMTVMQKNLEDAWTTFTQQPSTQRTAAPLPTAFMSFVPGDDGTYTRLPDPVRLPTPSPPEQGAEARLTLRVTALDAQDGDERAAVAALLERVSVRRSPDSQSYLLVATDGPDDEAALSPGSYEGLVYLTKPSMALAAVRIVVEPRKDNG